MPVVGNVKIPLEGSANEPKLPTEESFIFAQLLSKITVSLFAVVVAVCLNCCATSIQQRFLFKFAPLIAGNVPVIFAAGILVKLAALAVTFAGI